MATPTAQLGGRQPVMTLAPSPANIDVMLASELLEAGRALANGFVTPERTTLIASTHRIYTVEEKLSLGDGRYDSERIVATAKALARRAILTDFHRLSASAGAMINAALFGALAGCGVLPLSRAACEAAIRSAGKGADTSLKGFALGYDAAEGKTPAAVKPTAPARSATAPAPAFGEKVRERFPAAAHSMIEEGLARVTGYLDEKYAALYLERLEPIAKRDHEHGGAERGALTRETARFLALWMSYEDVIRVADLKSRRSRFERVRADVQAKADQPVRIIEYLKPGVEELAALLPTALSQRLVAWAEKRGLMHKLNIGLHVNSSSVSGFLMLRALAWLRPLRRVSARYAEEQALMTRWLRAITAAPGAELALEIALCGRLIKGYGDTNRHAKASFLRIFDTLVDGAAMVESAAVIADPKARAEAVRAARTGALADPEGRGLAATLATQGIAPLPPQPKIIQFMRRPATTAKAG
jgi:indolepyruvate ferredoxin oxidoreductase beta subunit